MYVRMKILVGSCTTPRNPPRTQFPPPSSPFLPLRIYHTCMHTRMGYYPEAKLKIRMRVLSTRICTYMVLVHHQHHRQAYTYLHLIGLPRQLSLLTSLMDGWRDGGTAGGSSPTAVSDIERVSTQPNNSIRSFTTSLYARHEIHTP